MRRFWRKISYYLVSILRLMIGVKNWGTLFRIFLCRPFNGLRWLELRRNHLRVAVTSKMEAWSVKESLLDRFYTRYSDPIQADWTIVDIGSSIGEFSVEAALQVPEGRVISFEPNPGSLNIMRQNLRENSIKNVETHNIGIWKESGEITLEICPDDPIHGRSVESEPSSDDSLKRTSIPVISLSEMMETIVQGKVDLLKLDTEGTEFEILMSQPADAFERIERLITEVHESQPEKTVESLSSFLKGLGYKTRRHENKVHDDLHYLYAWRESSLYQ